MSNGPFYPQALYLGKVVNHGLSETSTGKPQFFLEFTVEGEIINGEVRAVQANYNRTIYQVFTDKTVDFAVENIKRLCAGAGIPCNLTSFGQLDPTHDEAINLVDVEFDAYCKHEMYNGETKERWSIAKGNDGGAEHETLDAKSINRLDAMFGKVLDKKQPAPTRKRETVPATDELGDPPGPPSNDEIPF